MAELEQFFGKVVDVVRRTDGDELTAAAGIAETVLHVGDTADFDETGGTVQIGDDTYTYLELDHDANTITLAEELLASADVGDRVDVIDEELGQVVVEYVAHILMEDQDRGDEPLEVTVQHSLVNLLSESIRGGVTESVTLLRDGEDDLVIWQVDGKIVEDIALEEVKTEIADPTTGLQAIYDLADSKATEAYVNATAATISQTAANGKSKVTYSASVPGSAANNAGDIWFRKDVATQTIIGQWEGLGGTSWSQKTLNDAVIANLDAGKLVAGSAFTNALWVKTNFTLGDASSNGVIQSYNFASSPVGVFIDKTGLVAKGGSIAGATVTGGTVTGATVQTSGSANTGTKIDSSGITIYSGGASVFQALHSGNIAVGARAFFDKGMAVDGFGGDPSIYASHGVRIAGVGPQTHALIVNSGGVKVDGNSEVTGRLNVSGELHGNTLWSDTDNGGAASGADIGADGKIKRATSSKRYKKLIRKAKVNVEAVLALTPKTFKRKDEKAGPEYLGLIAEEVEAAGVDHLIFHNAAGEVDGVHYNALTVSLLAVCQSQQAQIDALTARIEALEN